MPVGGYLRGSWGATLRGNRLDGDPALESEVNNQDWLGVCVPGQAPGPVRWGEVRGVVMQRERVQDQYPWTWEIPVAVGCGLLVVGVTACQLARSVANGFAGAGWWWPSPDKWVTSIPSLLAGDAAAGLPTLHHAAGTAVLFGWLAVVGLLTVAGFTFGGWRVWSRWGPARMRGMATVAEAHRLLGVDRLRKQRHVVRPDLYPAHRKALR